METNWIKNLLRATLAIAFSFAVALPATVLGQNIGLDHPKVKEVINVQAQFTPGLMAQPEILGTAVGEDADGEIVLVVYVNSEAKNLGEVMRALPPTLKGKRVRPELTDRFIALVKPSGGGTVVSHKALQTAPIQLGTSGGWRNDLANGYCCGGTLGSLVQVNGVQYILSNYHVFESDIVNGGNNLVATTGDAVIQPGLIDVSCSAASAQNVGTLVKLGALPGSNVDCSIAQVVSGKVRTDGAILEIGALSSGTLAAKINQVVKKSGRTTGLTRSKISGLNATISVAYDNECAGGAAFTKTFTGQIVIANKGSKFLAGGDSGSLLVEDAATNPQAVGLLYAGSSTTAIANPIDEVLTFVGGKVGKTATMVGN